MLNDWRVVVLSGSLVARFAHFERTQPAMIIVIATVQCKTGHREDFLVEFRKLVPEVLPEDGCIEYGPTIDAATGIGNQSVDENRVTIVEKWESVAALKAHLVAPHMEAYRPKVKGFVESSELRVLETA